MIDPGKTRAGLLVAALAATMAFAQASDPLGRITVGKSGPGWDGVELGASLVKVERLVRATLGIGPGDRRPVCSEFAAEADHEGIWLVLGFPSARPGAKLESIWVRFEGELVAASRQELVESLRRKFPAMTWISDPAHPEAAEDNDPTPVYQVGSKPATVIRLVPREGMLIARGDCLVRTGS